MFAENAFRSIMNQNNKFKLRNEGNHYETLEE